LQISVLEMMMVSRSSPKKIDLKIGKEALIAYGRPAKLSRPYLPNPERDMTVNATESGIQSSKQTASSALSASYL
jgi:hypothetical protein